MSVIVFPWGLHRKLASRFILGPVSFLAITRALFFSQAKEWSSKFPKYIELFWATIRQITSYWGNMTSRKEYYASRDASKVYQSVSILLFSWMECAISVCVSPWYTYILKFLLKVFKKRIQEGLDISPNIAAFTPSTVDPSVKSLVEADQLRV